MADRRYLVDNSVWQRLSKSAVRAAFDAIRAPIRPGSVLTCPPVVAEVGFSARNGADHSTVTAYLAAFPGCREHPDTSLVLAIQNALWHKGLVRSVGAIDTLIAAYAVVNGTTVLHYDSDFEHIASVRPDFRHRWIVPRGSLTT